MAIIINIPTHNHVNLSQPSSFNATADFIIAASGFLPRILPDAKTPAIIIETIVGLIPAGGGCKEMLARWLNTDEAKLDYNYATLGVLVFIIVTLGFWSFQNPERKEN